MTGYPAIDSAVSAIKGGAMDYLQKQVFLRPHPVEVALGAE